MSLVDKRQAAIDAPMGPGLLHPDSRVVARPGWYQLLTPSAPRGALNEVCLSQVDPDDAERVIDQTVSEYRAAGQPVKWCVGPWTRPADFGERLARRGFASWSVRGMGCDTSTRLAETPEVRVREIDRAALDEYLDVQWRGWFPTGAPSELDRTVHAGALAQTPRVVHLFAAERAGALIGTAAMLMREGYGYLIGGQVLDSARGCGAYRAMVAARLAFLAERGVGYAVTQARASTSAPILEKLGFETLFESTCYRLD